MLRSFRLGKENLPSKFVAQLRVQVSANNHPMQEKKVVSFGHATNYALESGQPGKGLFGYQEVVVRMDLPDGGRVVHLVTSFISVVFYM